MYNSFPKILSWEYEKIMSDNFTRRLRCVHFEGSKKVLCYVGDDYHTYNEIDYFEIDVDNHQSILDCVQYALQEKGMSNKDLICNELFH